MGIDQGPVFHSPIGLENGLLGRNIDRHCRIADLDLLAGFQPDLAEALDRLPIEFGAVGTAEILDPILPFGYRDPGMRPRYPQIRRQIDVDLDPVARPTDHHRRGRLVEDPLVAPVTVAYPHVRPSGCSLQRRLDGIGSSRLADKSALQARQPREGVVRQRALLDRSRGVFELLHCRVADEHSRNGVIGDREAQ